MHNILSQKNLFKCTFTWSFSSRLTQSSPSLVVKKSLMVRTIWPSMFYMEFCAYILLNDFNIAWFHTLSTNNNWWRLCLLFSWIFFHGYFCGFRFHQCLNFFSFMCNTKQIVSTSLIILCSNSILIHVFLTIGIIIYVVFLFNL